MKLTIPFVLSLLAAGRQAFANPAAQQSLSLQDVAQYDAFLSTVTSPGVSAVEGLSNFIMSSLSEKQREELLVALWEQHDVVDIMKMTGHGDGLDEERLVHVFGEELPRVVTEGEKLRLKKSGYDFMDITDHPDLGQLNAQRIQVSTASLRNSGIDEQTKLFLKAVLTDIDDKHLRADITKLSSFWNRSYRSGWGLLSSDWIHDQVEGIFTSSGNTQTVASVSKFKHKRYPQNSIIARIEGTDDSVKDKEIIIVSAHQDSLNYRLPFYRAPGADDDGSGSVTILQVLRSIVEQEFIPPPHLAVEFHWFAAEEGGLLGSQDIASTYEKDGKKVKGMLHMDMTAFLKNGTTPIVGFFDTDTDKNLTAFAGKLVDEYLPIGWGLTNCGKSCGSDHMSFTKAGYPAIFAAEGLVEDFANGIHTVNDDTDNGGQYSFEHMLEFVKLGITFIAELSAQK